MSSNDDSTFAEQSGDASNETPQLNPNAEPANPYANINASGPSSTEARAVDDDPFARLRSGREHALENADHADDPAPFEASPDAPPATDAPPPVPDDPAPFEASPYAPAATDAPASVPDGSAPFDASPYAPPVAPPHTVTSLPADAPYAAPSPGVPNPAAQVSVRQESAGEAPSEVHIGDLLVTREFVRSPQGVIPSRGTQIHVFNRTQMVNAIPTWAIIIAIVGFFIISVFSLLFLLVKEQRFSGGYEVVASGPNGTLTSFVPVTQQNAGFVWNDLQWRAELARTVVAAA